MKDVMRALKVQRRLAVKALKTIDKAIATVGGGVVKRKRRAKVARKAKAEAKPKAPKATKLAPKPAQGESLEDRKRKKREALAAATGTEG